jgi:hypothetical protein
MLYFEGFHWYKAVISSSRFITALDVREHTQVLSPVLVLKSYLSPHLNPGMKYSIAWFNRPCKAGPQQAADKNPKYRVRLNDVDIIRPAK